MHRYGSNMPILTSRLDCCNMLVLPLKTVQKLLLVQNMATRVDAGGLTLSCCCCDDYTALDINFR